MCAMTSLSRHFVITEISCCRMPLSFWEQERWLSPWNMEITDWDKERLKMSVKTPASYSAHAWTCPRIPSGSAILRVVQPFEVENVCEDACQLVCTCPHLPWSSVWPCSLKSVDPFKNHMSALEREITQSSGSVWALVSFLSKCALKALRLSGREAMLCRSRLGLQLSSLMYCSLYHMRWALETVYYNSTLFPWVVAGLTYPTLFISYVYVRIYCTLYHLLHLYVIHVSLATLNYATLFTYSSHMYILYSIRSTVSCLCRSVP